MGEEVLSDPLTIGSKSSSSQMALLSEEAYDTGRQRIKADVDAAAGQGAVLRFRECHDVHMAHGFKP
ncbi:MAG: hypothetical protein KGJ86_15025 [Chloroflexota bacterium]|nr:hypothetical protein [Chloroflexota bacterium]